MIFSKKAKPGFPHQNLVFLGRKKKPLFFMVLRVDGKKKKSPAKPGNERCRPGRCPSSPWKGENVGENVGGSLFRTVSAAERKTKLKKRFQKKEICTLKKKLSLYYPSCDGELYTICIKQANSLLRWVFTTKNEKNVLFLPRRSRSMKPATPRCKS